ncbi:MAG: hypothetical protein OCD01_04145 [Fibrobacterales bacterium]
MRFLFLLALFMTQCSTMLLSKLPTTEIKYKESYLSGTIAGIPPSFDVEVLLDHHKSNGEIVADSFLIMSSDVNSQEFLLILEPGKWEIISFRFIKMKEFPEHAPESSGPYFIMDCTLMDRPNITLEIEEDAINDLGALQFVGLPDLEVLAAKDIEGFLSQDTFPRQYTERRAAFSIEFTSFTDLEMQYEIEYAQKFEMKLNPLTAKANFETNVKYFGIQMWDPSQIVEQGGGRFNHDPFNMTNPSPSIPNVSF